MASVTFVQTAQGLERENQGLRHQVEKLTAELRALRGGGSTAVSEVKAQDVDQSQQARMFQSGNCTIRIVPLTGPVKMNPSFPPPLYAGATPQVGPAKTKIAVTRKPLVSVPNKVATAFSDEEVEDENATRFQLLEFK